VDLSTSVDPAGGVFAGGNITAAGMFNVGAAGQGDHAYTYTVSGTDGQTAQCTGTVTVTPVDPGPPPPPIGMPDGWNYQNPYPTLGRLHGVSQLDVTTAVTVGFFGAFLRTTDAGGSWVHEHSRSLDEYTDIAFPDANNGVLLLGLAITHTNDGGVTWNTANAPLNMRRRLAAVRFADASTAIAVGTQGEILRSTDGGANWILQTSGTTQDLNGVYLIQADTAFVVGAGGRILATDDGGAAWTSQSSGTIEDLQDVWFMDSSTGVVVGASGTVRRTINGGNSWTPVTSGTSTILNRLFFTDTNNGVAVGGGGTILRTIDGGASWIRYDSGVRGELRAVSFADAMVGTAVGGDVWTPHILRTNDGGVTWAIQSRTADLSTLSACASKNGATVIAVSPIGVIARSTDWGVTWAETAGPPLDGNSLLGISMPDAHVATIVGTGGTIIRTTDAGATWYSQNSPTSEYLFGVDFRDVHRGVAVGRAIVATEDGRTWEVRQADTDLRDVAWVTEDTLVAVGPSGTILQSIDGGHNWNPVYSGSGGDFNAVAFWGNGVGFAVAVRTASRTVDRGTTWTGQQLRGWDIATAPGGVAAVASDFGGVWVTGDWGVSWSGQGTNTPPLASIGLKGIALTNADVITGVGDYGMILRTFNGGDQTP